MYEIVCFAGGVFVGTKVLHWIVWNGWYTNGVHPDVEKLNAGDKR